MKNTKKLLSILLMLTLLLALGSQAFAAGTLTVVDDGSSKYNAYKIFDVNDNGSGDLTYSINTTGNEWFDELIDTTASGNSKFPGLTFTPDDATTPTKYTVTSSNTFSAAEFAEYLKPLAASKTAANGSTPFDAGVGQSVAPGYYLVIGNQATDTKAALTTVLDGQNVNIQNKNDMPLDKEIKEGSDLLKESDVQIGDTVYFQIKTKVPTDVAYDDTFYVFQISDTMDEGLTFQKPIEITIDSTALTTLSEVVDPTAILEGDQVRYNANGKAFELSLDMLTRGKPTRTDPANPTTQLPNALAGKDVVITYSAIVNEKAVSVISENKAVLEYGNDPTNLTVKDSETRNYTSRIVVDKYETGNHEQKLSGAEFILMNETKDAYYKAMYKTYTDDEVNPALGSTLALNTDYIDEGSVHYAIDANGDKVVTSVTWDTDINNATKLTTDSNGYASFGGLKDGTYYLKETKAPAGYTTLTEDIEVVVNGKASTSVGLNEDQVVLALTNVANVANTPGTTLPSTGGIGTTIFYLVGSVLVFGAAVVLILRKRSEA